MKKLLWGIYAAFAILLGLSLYLSGRYYDGLVDDHYYRNASGYLAEREREHREGLSIRIPQALREGHNGFVAEMSTSSGPLRDARVTLAAMRISGKEGDRNFALAERRPGIYAADVFLPAAGQWMFLLSAVRGATRTQKRWIATAEAAEAPGGSADTGLHEGPVTKSAGALRVTLSIDPKPVEAMRELRFTVEAAGYPGPRPPVIELSMPGMRMPPNRVELRKGVDGRFRGNGVIVRCPSGRRTWTATVAVPGAGDAVYTFDVAR